MKKPKQLRTTFTTYQIHDCVGEGGSGVVYSASDDNGSKLAIKILEPAKASKDRLKRFENEFRFCSRNKHPNIITVLDHGLVDDSVPFFVMPLYEGSFRGLIGKLSPRDALTTFEKILDGVEGAHKLGVIHRDLKPENILVNSKGKELVIADFGIATFEEEELFTAVETKDNARLANFQYAAPEQRVRGKPVDKRADIYALGLILNELYTHELAIGTNYKTISSITSDYPYLDPIVEKMLQQLPSSRFNDIDEIKRELIARGEEHISRQKVAVLKDRVIPTTDLDDPIVEDPMQIVGVDWDKNILKISLNHEINAGWQWALQNMGNYTSVMGRAPENFRFSGNIASVSAPTSEAQQIVNYFKEWLPIANRVYKEKLQQIKEKEEREQREVVQRRIKEEEERIALLDKLRF